MSTYNYSQDKNRYFRGSKSVKQEAIALLLVDHAHADEIMRLVNQGYTPERLPHNGGRQYKNNAPSIGAGSNWDMLRNSYNQFIRYTERWRDGVYNTETKSAIALATKVRGVILNMATDSTYAVKLRKRASKDARRVSPHQQA